MCGELKYEGRTFKLGNLIPYEIPSTNGIKSYGYWSGFARWEKMSFWKQVGKASVIQVPIDGFTEGNQNISIKGKIVGLVLSKDVIVNGQVIGKEGSVKLLTRKFANPQEKKVHSRWPIVKNKEGKILEFLREKVRQQELFNKKEREDK